MWKKGMIMWKKDSFMSLLMSLDLVFLGRTLSQDPRNVKTLRNTLRPYSEKHIRPMRNTWISCVTHHA